MIARHPRIFTGLLITLAVAGILTAAAGQFLTILADGAL